jgi:hypothetical protein
MKNFIATLIICIVVWQGYSMHRHSSASRADVESQLGVATSISAQTETPGSAFRCDGRTYCSQMTSCAEATHFLKHCPGVKMDGDNDGIPCEQQLCRR